MSLLCLRCVSLSACLSPLTSSPALAALRCIAIAIATAIAIVIAIAIAIATAEDLRKLKSRAQVARTKLEEKIKHEMEDNPDAAGQ